MTDLRKLADEQMPDWARWKGDAEVPASWYAINPETGERTKVYRSYSDYCDD